MIDIEIVKFYNSVKDPLWPDICNYNDYHRLPTHIKNECNTLHNFQFRKEELCNPDYWIYHTLDVCVYKNLAYVPVPKCAYTYHTTLFTELGWEQVPLYELDIENTKFFGLLMHPYTRRLKGVTEWVIQSYYENSRVVSLSNPWNCKSNSINWSQLRTDINTKYFRNLLGTIGFGDVHSFPYGTMFGSLLHKINWIPMDILNKTEIQISLMDFFKLHGHDIQLPLDNPPLHVSDKNQLQIYDIVKEIFNNDSNNIYQFYRIYGNDLNFYYNLVDNFTPDWQHL